MYFHGKIKRSIYIFLLLVFVPFYLTAQQEAIKQTVTFDVKQVSLYDVFSIITRQTGIRFSYNSKILDTNKKITIRVTEQDVNKVLSQILPSSVQHKQIGKYIVLSPSESKTVPEKKQDSKPELNAKETEVTGQHPEKEIFLTPTEEKIIDSIFLKKRQDTLFIQKISSFSNGLLLDNCHKSVTSINIEDMNKKLALVVLGLATTGLVSAQTVSDSTIQNEKKELTTEKKPAQVSFIYPLGTDWVNSYNNEYSFSFNMLGGNTGKINGTEIGGIYNINKYTVNGVQVAGVFNLTGVDAQAEDSKNVQVAGILNSNRKGISEQISGVINMADNSALQIGGVMNAAKERSNVQVSGVLNMAKKSNTQVAGIINIADTVNVQVAGINNIASSSSCQVSGILNVTGKGGFQLGLVNVRDTVDGVSVGLVNIVKKGGLLEFGIEGSEIVHGAVTFRSGSKKLYSIVALGYNFSDEFFAVGVGLGTQFTFTNRLGLNLEGIHYNLYDNKFKSEKYNGLVQIRPLLNFKIANHFKIYAGPSINLSLIDPEVLTFTVPYSIWDNSDKRELNAWIGVTGGIKF